jgi:WD40 repeat protein/uncharacterized caspase-like protein
MMRGNHSLTAIYGRVSFCMAVEGIVMKRIVQLILCVICWCSGLCQISFGQQQELVVQIGHVNDITSVAFSADGRLLASGSHDETIKLWDITTGRVLRTFSGHTLPVLTIAFSPDSKILASGSSDGMIKLWSVVSGQELKTLRKHVSSVNPTRFGVDSINFSPDGKMLASVSNESFGDEATIELWDVASGQELSSLKGHTSHLNSVIFSPDGKMLASGSDDGTARLWDVASGKEIKSLSVNASSVNSAAFSPDGKMLALGIEGIGSDDITLQLWDVSSGLKLKTLEGHPSGVHAVAFSPDSKMLASGGGDRTIKFWDVATGKKLKTLSGHFNIIASVVFSPDGKTIASGSWDTTIKLWDISTGRQLKTFDGHTLIRKAALSPDGKTLLSGTWDGTIKLWNLVSGDGMKSLEGHTNITNSVVFSPDGKMLASTSFDRTTKLWSVLFGKELQTLKGYDAAQVVFSPDSRTIALSKLDKVALLDIESGRESKTLIGHTHAVVSVVFSPDGRTIASAGIDQTIKLWDVATGKELRTLPKQNDMIFSVLFSPDGKMLASRSRKGSVKLWNPLSGQEIKTLSEGGNSQLGINLGKYAALMEAIIIFPESKLLAFSSNGKTLASESPDKSIKLWDVASGKELQTFQPDDPNTVREIFAVVPDFYSGHVTPDGRFHIEWGENGKLNLYELKTGKLLASLIAMDEMDWLVITPQGFFDGTPNAWRQLTWRFNHNTFDYGTVELYFNEFFYPTLLPDVLAGKSPKLPIGRELAKIDRRQPQVEIISINGQSTSAMKLQTAHQSTIEKRMVTVMIEVADNISEKRQASHPKTSGAQALRLFRNGSLVKVWTGNVFDKASGCKQIQLKPDDPHRVRCQAVVPIIAGDNNFTAYAFNSSNVKSNDDIVTIKGADSLKRAGTLYVLAIGVGQYENSQYNLNYTVADAQAFGEGIKQRQEQIKHYARTEVLPLLNEHARKANILTALNNLAESVQPEDGVIVYFSGHGTAQKDRFYLIPHDIGYMGARRNLTYKGLQAILAHSVSDVELEAAFRGIDAGRLLLVIDACNSGQALDAEEKRRGPMNSRGLAQLAYEKGMYALTASQSVELAFESEALKHSYLTYALVEEGLKSRVEEADENGDGEVWLRELFDYTVQRVPRMREEKVEQTSKPQNKSLEIVEAKERGKVQTPRVFYRREADPQPWVIALAK